MYTPYTFCSVYNRLCWCVGLTQWKPPTFPLHFTFYKYLLFCILPHVVKQMVKFHLFYYLAVGCLICNWHQSSYSANSCEPFSISCQIDGHGWPHFMLSHVSEKVCVCVCVGLIFRHSSLGEWVWQMVLIHGNQQSSEMRVYFHFFILFIIVENDTCWHQCHQLL